MGRKAPAPKKKAVKKNPRVVRRCGCFQKKHDIILARSVCDYGPNWPAIIQHPALASIPNIDTQMIAPCWYKLKANARVCIHVLKTYFLILLLRKQPNECLLNQRISWNVSLNTCCKWKMMDQCLMLAIPSHLKRPE